MPYPYGYAAGGTPNPFFSAVEATQAQQAAQQSIRDQIQQAYINREAAARVDAKQQHDFDVDKVEQQMKLQAGGAQPVAANGTIPGTAATQYGDISSRVQGAMPAPDPVAQNSDDPTTRMSQLPTRSMPDMTPTSASADQQADPSRTVTALSGQQYQLPTPDETRQRAVQQAMDLETGKKLADVHARTQEIKENGVPMGQDIADAVGGDPSELITRDEKVKYTSYLAPIIKANAAQENADTKKNAPPPLPKTEFEALQDSLNPNSPTAKQSALLVQAANNQALARAAAGRAALNDVPLSPGGAKIAAKLATGDYNPAQLSRFKDKEAIMGEAVNQNPDWTPQLYAAKKSFTDPEGTQAKNLGTISRIVGHISRFEQNSNALGVAPGYAMGMNLTGRAAATSNDTHAISAELEKLTSGGVGSEAQTQQWQKSLSSPLPQVRQQAIDEISRLIGSQYEGMNQTYKAAGGGNLPVQQFVSPAGQQWMRSKGINVGGGPAAAPQSAAQGRAPAPSAQPSGTPTPPAPAGSAAGSSATAGGPANAAPASPASSTGGLVPGQTVTLKNGVKVKVKTVYRDGSFDTQ